GGTIAINKIGVILGSADLCDHLQGCGEIGWLWIPTTSNASTGTSTAIPFPAGYYNSNGSYHGAMAPTALNATRQVVGTLYPLSTSTNIIFLYAGGVIYDLGVLSGALVGGSPVGI